VVSEKFGCGSYVEFCYYHKDVGNERGQLATSFSCNIPMTPTDNIAHGLRLFETVAVKRPWLTSVISMLDVHHLETLVIILTNSTVQGSNSKLSVTAWSAAPVLSSKTLHTSGSLSLCKAFGKTAVCVTLVILGVVLLSVSHRRQMSFQQAVWSVP